MAPQGTSFTSSFSEFLVAIFSYQFFRKRHPLLQVLLLQAEKRQGTGHCSGHLWSNVLGSVTNGLHGFLDVVLGTTVSARLMCQRRSCSELYFSSFVAPSPPPKRRMGPTVGRCQISDLWRNATTAFAPNQPRSKAPQRQKRND